MVPPPSLQSLDKTLGKISYEKLTRECLLICLHEEGNQNLFMSQKELLLWHNCLGRFNVKLIQACFKKLDFKLSIKFLISVCCLQPLQNRSPQFWFVLICCPTLRNSWFWNKVTWSKVVSINQSTSRIVVILAHTKDHECPADLCSFKSSRDGDIIIGKYLFNNSARTHKVKIFLSYWQWCLFCRNITTLSDTWLYWGWCSPHHQHGVSEHTIQTISWWDILRCCRHFLHWPAQTDLKLWPFALLCSRVSKKTQNL